MPTLNSSDRLTPKSTLRHRVVCRINFRILTHKAALDRYLGTGGEVEDINSGCLLHNQFEGRDPGLFRCFSLQPVSELYHVHCRGDGDMSQVSFAKADVA